MQSNAIIASRKDVRTGAILHIAGLNENNPELFSYELNTYFSKQTTIQTAEPEEIINNFITLSGDQNLFSQTGEPTVGFSHYHKDLIDAQCATLREGLSSTIGIVKGTYFDLILALFKKRRAPNNLTFLRDNFENTFGIQNPLNANIPTGIILIAPNSTLDERNDFYYLSERFAPEAHIVDSTNSWVQVAQFGESVVSILEEGKNQVIQLTHKETRTGA